MNPKIIVGSVNPSFEYKVVNASTAYNGEPVLELEAIFQKANVPNKNGQRFPLRALAEAIALKQDDVKERHFMGELDHPSDLKDINRIANVKLEETSHVITRLEMDGDWVVGKLETLPTPKGKILASLIDRKIKIGVSIRAVTTDDVNYSYDDVNTIQNFDLIAYDAVHNPAYEGAYIKGVMSSTFKIYEIDSSLITPIKNKEKIYTLTSAELKDMIKNTAKAILSNKR